MSILPKASTVANGLREQWDRVQDRTVRVAVTGLSQSGKTNFITSVVNQLLDPKKLPRLVYPGTHEKIDIVGAQLLQLPDIHVPPFLYQDHLDALRAQQPVWPSPTDRLRGVRIGVRYRSREKLLRGRVDRKLYIDLLDYPGEWLLDLPLMNLTFDEWSRRIYQQCEREPRRSLATDWMAAVEGLNPSARFTTGDDEPKIQRIQRLYTEFLRACKNSEHRLSYLQPGYFLMPGRHADTLPLSFFPMRAPEKVAKHSLYAELRRRFEVYKKHVVGAFYREHFSSFDRQIVLVDVIKALTTGPETFLDMQKALEVVLENFRYGRTGILGRLFSGKIDKLVFAATKADHVATTQHANLRALLAAMINQAKGTIGFKSGLEPEILVLSAVRCTETVEVEHEGRTLSCLRGVTTDSEESRILYPGEVPASIPAAEPWSPARFAFHDYRPPRMLAQAGDPLPHINLDVALAALIGDKFE